jgi:diadenosine tetraphosphate (Ap4A) HIT family hydrolase
MIMDLAPEDQLQLLKEIDWTQKILWDIFNPTHLNIAAIGNKTPQLHMHVIARSSSDPAWPNTVWDHPVSDPYPSGEGEEIIHKLFEAYETFMQPVGDAGGGERLCATGDVRNKLTENQRK